VTRRNVGLNVLQFVEELPMAKAVAPLALGRLLFRMVVHASGDLVDQPARCTRVSPPSPTRGWRSESGQSRLSALPRLVTGKLKRREAVAKCRCAVDGARGLERH
jgi:hypothetical protein